MKKTALEHFQDIKELEVADERGSNIEDLLPYKCEQVEKSLKALEIIKEKNVDIVYLKQAVDVKCYNNMITFKIDYREDRKLTEEEFDLLKEGLE